MRFILGTALVTCYEFSRGIVYIYQDHKTRYINVIKYVDNTRGNIMIFVWLVSITIIAIVVWRIFRNDKSDSNKYYKNQKNKNNNFPEEEYKSSKEKGDYGERTVRNSVYSILNPNDRMLNNYITQGTSSATSQIDHIVIKPSGVYVIETKNYEGVIYGKRDDFYWIQVLAGGHVKNQFYNPIKQNATHIKNIKKYIGEKIPIYSMVVFMKADINPIAWIEEVYTHHRMLLKFEYDEGNVVLSNEDILKIYENLKEHKENITDEEHIENINKFLSNN